MKKKEALVSFMKKAEKTIPDVFISIPVLPEALDGEVISAAQSLFCSFEIEAKCSEKNNSYIFDKKLYSKKAALLNNAALVFGFNMDYAVSAVDSLKAFRDRIDFALSLYPNHINFPQFYQRPENVKLEKCTGTFSSQDIRYAENIAIACTVFYSAGRAVPWFLSVLEPLKTPASKFFADFAEWLRCNNYHFNRDFDFDSPKHSEIEKMQLLFLEMKYEEKSITSLFPVVHDVVRLNGAFSRLEGEGEECVIETSFNPDDILSPAALNISKFADTVCMEECRVKIFAGEEYPDYKIIS